MSKILSIIIENLVHKTTKYLNRCLFECYLSHWLLLGKDKDKRSQSVVATPAQRYFQNILWGALMFSHALSQLQSGGGEEH